jgi:predicted CoA-substrate-specific enzyme activase
MIVCGCDVGSRTAKVVLLGNGKILGSGIAQIVSRDRNEAAGRALKAALDQTGISQDEIAYSVGTGYGNVKIPFVKTHLPEMTCHASGANWVSPRVQTVIDIGGQDCKVMRVDEEGNVVDFTMNDKCASGTGQFLEDIAGVLHMKVEELGKVSEQSTERVKISNQCSVFALSEVISLVALKVPVPDIVAGIHGGIANRVLSMVHRLGLKEDLLLSGGVAGNPGLVREIESRLETKLFFSPEVDHRILGALGAAIHARRELEKNPES